MYRLVLQTKLACTREPRNEANKSSEYGEVFRGLLLSFQNDVGIGNRAEGEYVVPLPGRAYAHRVYRKSGFGVGQGKKVDERHMRSMGE